MSLNAKDTRRYVYVRDGEIKEKVTADTEGAKLYEYELRDGSKGSKHELTYKSISGKIVNVELHEGDFGTNLNVTFDFDNGDEPVTLSLGTATNYGEDMMKKLPAVNFAEHVAVAPYSFEDKGKVRKGLSVTQGDVKIQNFFYDAENKKNINDFPEPAGDTTKYTKTKWQTYFTVARDFLVDYTAQNVVTRFNNPNF